MDWLRSKVSGKRNRYKDDEYNLDITYITDRIIAMSFPASGIEKGYRNNINKVSNFLEERHSGNYRIYNLSNRSYNETKFKAEVKSYKWEDHHSPPILMLFNIGRDMYDFLLDPNHVIVVHCNAGKGRTGTSIAGFLIYSGLANTSHDAIRYYGRKRFSTGLGITQPSQIRYVRYFELIFKGVIVSPCISVLKQVKMCTIPHMNGKSGKPFLEIVSLNNFKGIYTGKNCDYLKTYKEGAIKSKSTNEGINNPGLTKKSPMNEGELVNIDANKLNIRSDKDQNLKLNNKVLDDFELLEQNINYLDIIKEESFAYCEKLKKAISTVDDELKTLRMGSQTLNEIILPHSPNQILEGDLLFRIKHKGSFGTPLIGRIGLNTSFILSNEMKFTIKDLDPVSIRKDDKFSSEFEIVIVTEPYCQTCTSQTPLEKLCLVCKPTLSEEIKIWK